MLTFKGISWFIELHLSCS